MEHFENGGEWRLRNYSSTVNTASLSENIRMQHKDKPKKELKLLKSEYEEPKTEILKILTPHTVFAKSKTGVSRVQEKANRTALRKGIRFRYYHVHLQTQAVS